MLVRELHVNLPGELSAEESARRDERATEVYERVTVGIGAVEAGMIADEMATMRQAVGGRRRRTSMPAALARLAPAGERR